MKNNEKELLKYLSFVDKVFDEVRRFVVGQKSAISRVVLGLLSVGQITPISKEEKDFAREALGGCIHMLLEGAPGLVKTTMLSILAKACSGSFNRIQCTPDLLPVDITGVEIPSTTPEGKIVSFFKQGPIHANFVLADEINRTSPETDSAFLEAMSSRTVTIPAISANSKDRTVRLPNPFLFTATQNPVEEKGVKQLPVAHYDRFGMKVIMANPTTEELERIQEIHENYHKLTIDRVISLEELIAAREFIHHKIYVSDLVRKYIARLAHAFIPFPFSDYDKAKYEEAEQDKEFFENWKEIWSRKYQISQEHECTLRELIAPGPSAARSNIFMRNLAKALTFCRNKDGFRDYVLPADVKKIAPDVLRHRIVLANRGRIIAQQFGSREALIDRILAEIIERVIIPQ